MNYRKLGSTGLMVSEIGFGGEWTEKLLAREVDEIIDAADAEGINILDCLMCNPTVRTNLGHALRGRRDRWVIQGHLCSTWQNGQYVRTRDMAAVKPAFEDLLARFETDYMDIGVIHFVDEVKDYEAVMHGELIEYAKQLKAEGKIRHIGMSTHNTAVATMAAQSGLIEVILFSVNPAFDMLPPAENIDDKFIKEHEAELVGVNKERDYLYRLCEHNGVGITVMKAFAGGGLLNADHSFFGVALTPVQCIHYALTRPAVASVMAGYTSVGQVKDCVRYETATDEEKDYSTVLATAPKHAYTQGRCTYCGHCSPCPKAIDIASVNKYIDLADIKPEVPATVKAHYEALSANADDCISCGACEARCPFGVRIIERMAQARELFR